jgi:simple sugar transport system permease protein
VIVIILQILRLHLLGPHRSVGENSAAADNRRTTVAATERDPGGAFAGLAGAYLTLEATGSFQNQMTTGRGFIALAAVIFGRWTPLGAWGAALLFSFTDALSVAIGLDPPTGTLGEILNAIPAEFYACCRRGHDHVLAGVVGRSVAPAAVGRPYTKESQT